MAEAHISQVSLGTRKQVQYQHIRVYIRRARKDLMKSRNSLRYLAAAALLSALPAVSPAQLPTGRSGFSSERSASAREYWIALRYFGRCFASTQRAAALEFLATEPGSAQEVAVYRRLFEGHEVDCIGEMSRMTVIIKFVRGAIAEGLLGLGTPIPPQLAVAPLPPGAPITTLSDLARCYVAGHRAAARALIDNSRPGSDEELAALAQMQSDIFRCVPPAASNVRFNPTDIRFHLAEALLRMPADPAAPRP